jgi:hypothetical protein
VNHEPEDLLGALTVVPSRAGERVRMKKRVQSSGSTQALGIFSFEPMEQISGSHYRMDSDCSIDTALAWRGMR